MCFLSRLLGWFLGILPWLLCIQHIPFIAEHPTKRRKLAVNHSPFEIVPWPRTVRFPVNNPATIKLTHYPSRRPSRTASLTFARSRRSFRRQRHHRLVDLGINRQRAVDGLFRPFPPEIDQAQRRSGSI